MLRDNLLCIVTSARSFMLMRERALLCWHVFDRAPLAGIDTTGVAWGYYFDWTTDAVTGFGQLSVVTNPAYNDTTQMFGAGYVEGALTQARIAQQFYNVNEWLMTEVGNPIPAEFQTFFVTQDAWTRAQVAANSSPQWTAVGLVLAQFDGLMAGYAAVAPAGAALDTWAFQQLNAVGDFLDLIPGEFILIAHPASLPSPVRVCVCVCVCACVRVCACMRVCVHACL